MERIGFKESTGCFRFFYSGEAGICYFSRSKSGGIRVNNTYPAEFIYDNLTIEINTIHASYQNGVKKLLFLGSSCIYPKLAPQPIKEEYLLTGELEPTNDAYAVAKIAGIKMCQAYNKQYGTNFIAVMPTNLYGQNDNFNLQSSHVMPALIRKFHEAKVNNAPFVEVWGTGQPRREFLYVDDLADACLYMLNHYNQSEIVNIGTGKDITIKELAIIIKNVVGFPGEIRWNTDMPDGTPQKLLDISKLINLGWKPKVSVEKGIEMTYQWFLKNKGNK